MHCGDVPGRTLQRRTQHGIERGERVCPSFARNVEGGQRHAVKLLGQCEQRLITGRSNAFDDCRRARTHGHVECRRAIGNGQSRDGIQCIERPACPQRQRCGDRCERCCHGTRRSMRVTRIPCPPNARNCEIVR